MSTKGYNTCEDCLCWDTYGICTNVDAQKFNGVFGADTIACESFVPFIIDDECEGCKLN